MTRTVYRWVVLLLCIAGFITGAIVLVTHNPHPVQPTNTVQDTDI